MKTVTSTRWCCRRLTLLLDPRTEVHATAGLLPVKSLVIPAQFLDAALSSLEFAFLAHPILSPVGSLQISVPQVDGFSWSFARRAGNHVVTDVVEEVSAPAFAPVRLVDGWLDLSKGHREHN